MKKKIVFLNINNYTINIRLNIINIMFLPHRTVGGLIYGLRHFNKNIYTNFYNLSPIFKNKYYELYTQNNKNYKYKLYNYDIENYNWKMVCANVNIDNYNKKYLEQLYQFKYWFNLYDGKDLKDIIIKFNYNKLNAESINNFVDNNFDIIYNDLREDEYEYFKRYDNINWDIEHENIKFVSDTLYNNLYRSKDCKTLILDKNYIYTLKLIKIKQSETLEKYKLNGLSFYKFLNIYDEIEYRYNETIHVNTQNSRGSFYIFNKDYTQNINNKTNNDNIFSKTNILYNNEYHSIKAINKNCYCIYLCFNNLKINEF